MFYIYLLAGKPHGTLYVGVTSRFIWSAAAIRLARRHCISPAMPRG
jgi:predicted GIY-YIG superfamily endonuclease